MTSSDSGDQPTGDQRVRTFEEIRMGLAMAEAGYFVTFDPNAVERLWRQCEAVTAALRGLEPFLDAIVCYASTMDEHEPNRLAFNARAALAMADHQSGAASSAESNAVDGPQCSK